MLAGHEWRVGHMPPSCDMIHFQPFEAPECGTLGSVRECETFRPSLQSGWPADHIVTALCRAELVRTPCREDVAALRNNHA